MTSLLLARSSGILFRGPDTLHEFTARQFADVRLVHDPEMEGVKGVMMLSSHPELLMQSMVEVRIEYRPTIKFPKKY